MENEEPDINVNPKVLWAIVLIAGLLLVGTGIYEIGEKQGLQTYKDDCDSYIEKHCECFDNSDRINFNLSITKSVKIEK